MGKTKDGEHDGGRELELMVLAGNLWRVLCEDGDRVVGEGSWKRRRGWIRRPG